MKPGRIALGLIVLSFIFLALAFLSGCAGPTNPEQWMSMERNACLPTAIAMAEGLKRQGIQSRVIIYNYREKGNQVGHAITAYLYPAGQNTLWTYDYEGSWRTRAFWDDAVGIAAAAERLRSRSHKIDSASFQ
jgi:hypothetical protein